MATITNLDSLRTLAGLSQSSRAISQASERISTGLRVNRASDDPAGMAVANDLKTQLTSYNQILTNVAEGQTVTNLVDTSLSQMVDLLGYMRVAAVAGMSSSISTSEATAYQDAIDAYVSAFDTIGSNTTWNGTSLMSTASTMSVQTGVNSGDTTTLTFDQITSTAAAVSIGSLDVTDTTSAKAAVASIDDAIDTLNVYQTYIGAMANVMESQSTVATNAITSYSAGYGAIMNADYAAETAKLAAAQIQHDGATAMLIQGNGLNRSLVDYLLGGPSTYAPRTS
jgi:flagellin